MNLERFCHPSSALFAVATGFLLMGCGEQTMPKGTGASGQVQQVLPEPDVGLELINKLTPEQQQAHAWLHQPFETAIPDVVGDEKGDPLNTVKGSWSHLEFANEKSNVRFDDTVTFATNVGTFNVEMNAVHSPNHVRNLILLMRSGFFVGKKPKLEGGVAWIGTAPEEEQYYLKSEKFAMIPIKGALIARTDDQGRSRGTEIGICLETLPDLRDKVTILAGVAGPEDDAVLTTIHDALMREAGSVTIERVEGTRKAGPLFTVQGVRLPTLEANGRPKVIMPKVEQSSMGLPSGFSLTPPAGATLAAPEETTEKPNASPPATP